MLVNDGKYWKLFWFELCSLLNTLKYLKLISYLKTRRSLRFKEKKVFKEKWNKFVSHVFSMYEHWAWADEKHAIDGNVLLFFSSVNFLCVNQQIEERLLFPTAFAPAQIRQMRKYAHTHTSHYFVIHLYVYVIHQYILPTNGWHIMMTMPSTVSSSSKPETLNQVETEALAVDRIHPSISTRKWNTQEKYFLLIWRCWCFGKYITNAILKL